MPRAKKLPVLHVDDDEWVEIAWTGQQEECCDCGLKHRVSFRVTDRGKLQFKAVRVK